MGKLVLLLVGFALLGCERSSGPAQSESPFVNIRDGLEKGFPPYEGTKLWASQETVPGSDRQRALEAMAKEETLVWRGRFFLDVTDRANMRSKNMCTFYAEHVRDLGMKYDRSWFEGDTSPLVPFGSPPVVGSWGGGTVGYYLSQSGILRIEIHKYDWDGTNLLPSSNKKTDSHELQRRGLKRIAAVDVFVFEANPSPDPG